jgi:hypothetical protein
MPHQANSCFDFLRAFAVCMQPTILVGKPGHRFSNNFAVPEKKLPVSIIARKFLLLINEADLSRTIIIFLLLKTL